MAIEIKKPQVAVLKTSGINCDEETKHAFDLAGADAQIIHINQFRFGEKRFDDFGIICIPGGFSYGDDIASGRVFALELSAYLGDQLKDFALQKRRPILGICNGFQILVQTGLLPFGEVNSLDKVAASLAPNDSGKFESRWIMVKPQESRSQYVSDGEPFPLPVAHGEGRFIAQENVLQRVEKEKLVVFRYVDASGKPTQEYPANPNGALNAIAGITDPDGRILGLMPHPERFVTAEQHPNFRRDPQEPAGLKFFQKMVQFARNL